jgi:hypothetical protein
MSSAELLTNPGWRTHHARLRRSRSTPSWLDRASSCAIIAVAAASLAYCTIATPAYCRQPALSTRAGCSERHACRPSSCSRSSYSRPDPESTRCTSARRAGGVRAAVVTAQGQPREQLQWPTAYLRAQHLRQRAQTAASVRARIAAHKHRQAVALCGRNHLRRLHTGRDGAGGDGGWADASQDRAKRIAIVVLATAAMAKRRRGYPRARTRASAWRTERRWHCRFRKRAPSPNYYRKRAPPPPTQLTNAMAAAANATTAH